MLLHIQFSNMLEFGRTRLLPPRQAASVQTSRRRILYVVQLSLPSRDDLWGAGDAEEGYKARQRVLPGGERASPAFLGSQPAPAPLSLSASPAHPLTFRKEKFSSAWRDDPVRPGDLRPLQALRQSLARPHLTAPAAPRPARCVPPTGPGTAGSVRLGLQPPVTSHQLQSHLQTQVAFTLPLEKKRPFYVKLLITQRLTILCR